jgi:crotonobetaine/carnitine-CoA ligase
LVVLTEPVDLGATDRALARLTKPPTVVSLVELCADGPRNRVWEPLLGSSLASIRYTSGTTGLAKGIMQSHLHMLNKSAAHNQFLAFGEQDILYSPFPLHHNLASINGLLGTIQAGGTMVSASRFSAGSYWDEMRTSQATLGHILDPLLPLLLKQPPRDDDRNHTCRLLWTAWPNREFEQRFGTRLLQIYALGEVGVISTRLSNQDEGSRAAGVPIPEMEVCIVDDLDRPLQQGATGEITVRPRVPHRVMLGYIGNLPATMRAFRNLWFHTGDAGFVDAAGELNFIGRIGDTIRRRGVNISSEQIEGELNRHPNLLECAVIGVPSEFGEEEIQAIVKWRTAPVDEAAALEELAGFLAGRLPRQYVPRYFEVIDDLPKTNTGKAQKNVLRARSPQPRRWDREAGP